MQSPFSSDYSDSRDRELVSQAVAGDRAALETLVKRHQPYIYNVAWKMVHEPDDAQDLAQEAWIKAITNLASFQHKSSFRTWLYRIVLNHFLQTKKRKCETKITSFTEFGTRLDNIPDPAMTETELFELAEQSEEMRISCMSGMLLCLSREQRLVFILGSMFKIEHKLGAEILEISPANFRIKLHRARKDLYNFMQNKCGLVNKNNPCRCPKKTKALIQAGAIDPAERKFNIEHRRKVYDLARATTREAEDLVERQYDKLYGHHPAQDKFNKEILVTEIVNHKDIQNYFHLN